MKSNLRPTRYELEEYYPLGMEGIIVYATLEIGISYGGVYVEDIHFTNQPEKTNAIPRAFIDALIKSIHDDDKLMGYIEDAAHKQYENEMEGY
jgi:hypothetical protein